MFSAVREKQFHWIETEDGIKPINYDYRTRPRRQDFQGILAENGACYMNSIKNILKHECRLSGKISAYEFPSETAYEIDEPSDWVILESIMNNRIWFIKKNLDQSIDLKKSACMIDIAEGA